MILVTTKGKVGAEAVRVLAGQGEPVRVLVRDVAQAQVLAGLGAEVVQGDLDDAGSLDRAMAGVRSVVLVSPAVPAQELNVVAAAQRAEVDHVVKVTSKASADSPIARRRNQSAIEEALIASGVGYTLLRNNVYMQNFLMLAPAIVATGGFGSSAGDGRMGMIDSRDVGAVAAAVAASPAAHVGKTYWPTGPEQISYADAAEILGSALGRPIGYVRLTEDQQREAMVKAGLPEPIAAMNAQALALAAEGDSAWNTDDVRQILGRPPRSFAEFVADHLTAFQPPAAPGAPSALPTAPAAPAAD